MQGAAHMAPRDRFTRDQQIQRALRLLMRGVQDPWLEVRDTGEPERNCEPSLDSASENGCCAVACDQLPPV